MTANYLRDEKSITAFHSECLDYRVFLNSQLEQIVEHMKGSTRNWKMVINIPDRVYDSLVDSDSSFVKVRMFRYLLPNGKIVNLKDFHRTFEGAKHCFTWHTVQYGFKKGTHYKERDDAYWSVLGMIPPFRQIQSSFLNRYGLYVTDETRSQMYPKIGISTSAPSGKIAKMWHGYNKQNVQKVATKSSQTNKYVDSVDPMEDTRVTRKCNRNTNMFYPQLLIVFTWVVLFLWFAYNWF